MLAILNFLSANPGDHFTSDIASSMDGVTEKQLSPVCTTLVGRGFIAKGEKGTKKVIDKKGLEVVREYNRYHITDAGLDALNQVA